MKGDATQNPRTAAPNAACSTPSCASGPETLEKRLALTAQIRHVGCRYSLLSVSRFRC